MVWKCEQQVGVDVYSRSVGVDVYSRSVGAEEEAHVPMTAVE